MAENLHKGWLYTREGEKFAPATLIESVYNRDGTQYYTKVKQYMDTQDDLISAFEEFVDGSETDLSDLQDALAAEVEARESKDTELEARLKFFDGNADDTLFIIDSSNNVIAYIDDTGVNSIDFTIPTTGESLSKIGKTVDDLEGAIEEINDKLTFFDGNADTAFYIIDNDQNVIAYIDEVGVHSTNFLTDETDFNTLVDRLDAIESVDLKNINDEIEKLHNTDEDITKVLDEVVEELTYFDGGEDDTFYILDKSNNVVAYIKDGGVYSIDFHPNEGRTLKTLNEDFNTHLQEFSDYQSDQTVIDRQQDDDIDSLTLSIENITTYFDPGEDDTLYILDTKNNIVAYIRDGGVYSVDFHLNETQSLAKLYQQINDLLKDADTYNTFDSIEEWIKSATVTIKQHGDNIDDLETALSNFQDQVGIPSDAAADYTLYGAVVDNAEAIQEIQENTQHFNGSTDDTLYIIDNDKNIVTYVDDTGIHAINLETPKGNFNQLVADVEDLIETHGNHEASVGIPVEDPDYDNPNGTLYDQVIKNKDDIATLNGDATVEGSVAKDIESLRSDLVNGAQFYKTFKDVDNALGQDYTAGQTTVKGRIKTAEDDIDSIIADMGEYPSGNDFPSNETIYNLIKANYDKIKILNSDSTVDGSVAYQIAQVVAGADESFDTLKEISDWIIKHPEDVAAMWKQINENTGKISDIIGEIGENTADSGQTIHQRIDDNDTAIAEIQENTQYFDGTSDTGLYIVDNSNPKRVVAYIDANGMHAINFSVDTCFNGEGVANADIEPENFNNLVSRVKTTEKDIDDLTGALDAFETRVGIPESPAYENPNPHITTAISDLYSQVMANQLVIKNLVADEGILETLEERLLGLEQEERSELNYETLKALGDIIGLSSETSVEGLTVFAKINTLDSDIDDMSKEIGAFEAWTGYDGDSDWNSFEGVDTYAANPATLLAAVIQNRIDINKLNNASVSDSSGKAVSKSIDERIAEHNTAIQDGAKTYITFGIVEDWIGDNTTGAQAAINQNASDIESIENEIGERGDNTSEGTIWSNIDDINNVFNNDEDASLYIIDNNNNVVAYIDANGIATTNVKMNGIEGLGYDPDDCKSITLNFLN